MLVMMLVNVVHQIAECLKPQICSSAQRVTVEDMQRAVEPVFNQRGDVSCRLGGLHHSSLAKHAVSEGAKALNVGQPNQKEDSNEKLVAHIYDAAGHRVYHASQAAFCRPTALPALRAKRRARGGGRRGGARVA